MELGSALEFLDNKSILVTGATGFLAKGKNISLLILLRLIYLISVWVRAYFDNEFGSFGIILCSFCGENTKSSTQCEEVISSFESIRP